MIKDAKGIPNRGIQKPIAIFIAILFSVQISVPGYLVAEEIQQTVNTSTPQSTFQTFEPFKPYQSATITSTGTATTTTTTTIAQTTSTTTTPGVVQNPLSQTSTSDPANPVTGNVDDNSDATDTSFLQSTSPLSQPTEITTVFDVPTTSSDVTETNIVNQTVITDTDIQNPASNPQVVEPTPPPATENSDPTITQVTQINELVNTDPEDIVSPITSPNDTGPQTQNPPIDPLVPGSSPLPPEDSPDLPSNPPQMSPPEDQKLNPQVAPFLGDPFRPKNIDERDQGIGSTPIDPFSDQKQDNRNDKLSTPKTRFSENDFVGGGLGIGFRLLILLLKGKGKSIDQNKFTQSEKTKAEKKNKNRRNWFQKLNAEQAGKTAEEKAKEEVLEQSGAIETDLSDLEDTESIVDRTINNAQNDSKQSPFGLEIASDLSPVHQILSNQDLSFNEATPKTVYSLPVKQRDVPVHSKPAMNPSRLLQIARVMSPATIHRVHQIVSPSDSGTRIQKFDSMGDPDL